MTSLSDSKYRKAFFCFVVKQVDMGSKGIATAR